MADCRCVQQMRPKPSVRANGYRAKAPDAACDSVQPARISGKTSIAQRFWKKKKKSACRAIGAPASQSRTPHPAVRSRPRARIQRRMPHAPRRANDITASFTAISTRAPRSCHTPDTK
ncbi:MAG: hypothetical protein BWY66_01851 [bacterium ADurb.Bin374]|nr:MAG: hypothetical protein BWY66_01851 [bacterium ADurb.Bin374]